MRAMIKWLVILLSFWMLSCSSGGSEDPVPINDPGPRPTTTFEWTIPPNQVFDGGVGRDGIPSIDQPRFAVARDIADVPDWEFVVVVKSGDEIKAYPHNILNWHEIVNDRIDGTNFALTYCPLTGTAIGWERGSSTFGVSGLLYNSNLIPYDRISGSYWSQMLNESVRGVRAEEKIERIAVTELRWQNFKAAYPDAQVLTRNTGFDRDYDSYPYGAYRGSADLLFPISRRDDRLFEKERVLGVQINDINRVYDFSSFEEHSFVYDQFDAEEIVVFGNREMGFMVSYLLPPLRGEVIQFTEVEDPTLQHFLTDQFGNQWNVFGEVVAGPNAGVQLTATPSYMGFFFAWATFNPTLEIF
ncbi:MAG: DUF3179 domain-containing protein [Cytophagales bacterium]|nr:DUF3179 domain-containing protein [Cytophagales bacterium]